MFKPFMFPNFANIVAKDGGESKYSLPLKELDENALDALVSQWLDSVYTKAGRPCPWTLVRKA